MSDKPIIQIDSDWKREAQEEKRKLAEEQAKAKKPVTSTAAAPATASASTSSADRAAARREMPPPSLATLIQSAMTQALYYLGELGDESQQPVLSLDMARHYIDTIQVLESKTKGNLTAEEQSLLDQTLYDLRSRFVGIARQLIQ